VTRPELLRRVRCERGQVAIEMLGTTGLLLLCALVAWQLALVGWSAVGAANAARTAARAYSRTGDAAGAKTLGTKSLQDDFLSTGSRVTVSGNTDARADVNVSVPIIVPGFDSGIHISASADMPKTG
jgi:alkylation response protein AidB-like acyl-CoA dehydrogenase